MALTINTNLAAITAYNNLSNTNDQMTQALNQLSSGLKVQTAADDAAGYVISQGLQAQSNGYGVAIDNAQNGISVLQTAEGALNQSTAILQKMNELATQAANAGSQDTASLNADNQEFQALQAQLDQIANTTSFGTTNLLNGSYQNESFQVGAYNTANNQVTVSIGSATAASLGVGSSVASIGTASAAVQAMSLVQAAISQVASQQAALGAIQNQLQAISANLTVGQQNIQASNSRIVDVNMAQEMTKFTTDQILMQAGVSMLSQAQQAPQMVLKLIG